MRRRGFFITFEGPEGSGKSTVIREAARFLRGMGYSVRVLREPGGTSIGEKIRNLLLDRRNRRMHVATEFCLYLAARSQIVREVIQPALKRGETVICDRYHDSTVVYQGYAGGLDLKAIGEFGRFVTGGLAPDLTFLLDVDVEVGLRRSRRKDRMERKSIAFHRKVRRGFLALARKNPSRMIVIKDEDRPHTKEVKVRTILHRWIRRKNR